MTNILLGKPIRDKIFNQIFEDVIKLKETGVFPKITTVRIGENYDDISYEKNIIKSCNALGINIENKTLPSNLSQDDLIGLIRELNGDDEVGGILVFRPLPKQIDSGEIENLIAPYKDIDCMSGENLRRIFLNERENFYPATPLAVIEMLKYYNIEIAGKRVCVINRSKVLGRSLSMMLLNLDATVILCHSKTKNLEQITQNSDIVITAVPQVEFFGKEFFNENSIIIDVTIGVNESGKLAGALKEFEIQNFVNSYTPVPKGVGSVTVAVMLRQLIEKYKNQEINNF